MIDDIFSTWWLLFQIACKHPPSLGLQHVCFSWFWQKLKFQQCPKLCNKASKLQLPKLITSSCLRLTSFINVFLCCLTNCFIIHMWELGWFVQNKTRWKGMNLFCLYREQITSIIVHWLLVYYFFQCRYNNQEMQCTFLSMHFHLHCIEWNVTFKLLIVY
jgi:hypothetical protein